MRNKIASGFELELGPRAYTAFTAIMFSAGYAWLAFLVPLLLKIKLP